MDRPPELCSGGGDTGPQPRSSSSGPLMSSVASEGSLREMWQMLDRDLSPSLLTEGTWWSDAHLVLGRSPGAQTLTWCSAPHLVLGRSPGARTLTWCSVAHLVLSRSPGAQTLTWCSVAHLVLSSSPVCPHPCSITGFHSKHDFLIFFLYIYIVYI